jgi:NitT/TauT family transport system ATP-binding protein
MTVIMVTHSLNEALFLADRLVVLAGKPARVVGDFRVPSPRPSKIEGTFSPEADALRIKVLGLLGGRE